jgi:hypothetical protein
MFSADQRLPQQFAGPPARLFAARRFGFIVHGSRDGFTASHPRAPGSPQHLMPCLAKPGVSWLSLSFGPSPIPIGYYGLC